MTVGARLLPPRTSAVLAHQLLVVLVHVVRARLIVVLVHFPSLVRIVVPINGIVTILLVVVVAVVVDPAASLLVIWSYVFVLLRHPVVDIIIIVIIMLMIIRVSALYSRRLWGRRRAHARVVFLGITVIITIIIL